MSSPQAHQAIPSFTTYPPVGELIRPLPGIEYLFVPAQEVNRAQRDGWSPLTNPIYFDIQEQPFTIMARGERLEGCQPESCQPMVFSTTTGDDMIGYTRKSDAPKNEARKPQGQEGDGRVQTGKPQKQ